MPHQHSQESHYDPACREPEDCGRQYLYCCSQEQVAVDIEQAPADQGCDIKDQKVLFIDETVRNFKGRRRKKASRRQDRAAKDAGNGPAQVCSHYRDRLSEGIEAFAYHHKYEQAANDAARQAAQLHTDIEDDQDPQV